MLPFHDSIAVCSLLKWNCSNTLRMSFGHMNSKRVSVLRIAMLGASNATQELLAAQMQYLPPTAENPAFEYKLPAAC